MRVLLVTITEYLPFALTQVLNPALEYCAIVVDEPDIAKKMLANVPPLRDKIFPLYELKDCVEGKYFDLVLCVTDNRMGDIWKTLNKYELPAEKYLHVRFADDRENFFLLERALRYYKGHAAEFEMFATGISFIRDSIDTSKFGKKIFNFALGGQDLYYDYQIAKFVLEVCGGGYIKYALIGITPFVFHYDESKSYAGRIRLFQYLIALNDFHNFPFSASECRKMFNEKFLNMRLNFDGITVNSVFGYKEPMKTFNVHTRIAEMNAVDGVWKKNYPETVKENIKILDDYLTLCEKNNVRPIMFTAPKTDCYKKYFYKKMLDEFYYLIGEAQRNHRGAIFLDGWKLPGFSDADFYDVGHLNINGAAKFSTILNNVIEN